jgi:O-antigen biosynthesis protein
MQKRKMEWIVRKISIAGLLLSAHIEAFWRAPGAYSKAAKWRILGKRVRARGQLAPLLAKSSRAYELWAYRSEPLPPQERLGGDHRIIALVTRGAESRDLEDTEGSLEAAGIAFRVVDDIASQFPKDAASWVGSGPSVWFMPLRSGDRVAKGAAATYLGAIAEAGPDCTVLYADDDKIDPYGRRTKPHFKPSWNAELHRHHDFLSGACIVRCDDADLVSVAPHPDWEERLVSAATQRGTVTHIPAVLHHRRTRPSAPAVVAPLAIADSLPPLSVIIPTRNRADLLRTSIKGLRVTDYPDMEIIVANNDSDDPETLAYLAELAGEGVHVLDQPGPFNYSTINNNAAAASRGELLCLMNNDIEVLSPEWLAIMATQALRANVGAVGAQLLYPDGSIQHAGVVIGVGNAAGHSHRLLRPEAEGYFRRHAMPQFVSAVTAACLVVQKGRFLAVGGLDEANFPVAYNDVDLCLRLNLRGWQSFYEPRAVLVHHESVSRGQDTDPVGAARFAGELAALQRIWRTDEIVDPFHHPMLSRASEQFALNLTSMSARSA